MFHIEFNLLGGAYKKWMLFIISLSKRHSDYFDLEEKTGEDIMNKSRREKEKEKEAKTKGERIE